MRGITLYQPHAFAVIAGLKENETRKRKTNIRGRVFIHAAKKHPYHAAISTNWLPAADYIVEALNGVTDIKDLPRGEIIGTVEIVDCVPVEDVIAGLSERERLLGDYSPGRYAWKLKDPRPLPYPIPAKGKQGWWNWDETEAYVPAMNAGIIDYLKSTGKYPELESLKSAGGDGMIHCFIRGCPNNDNQTDTCKKTDIAITEAGCLVYIHATQTPPRPANDGRDAK